MAVIGVHPTHLRPIASLSVICDIIRPGLLQLCRDNDMHLADVFADHATDCVHLVITDSKRRKYSHPRFITRQEIEDRSWLNLVQSRFMSCARGFADHIPEAEHMPSPSFTLAEIEQAQEIVDSLK